MRCLNVPRGIAAVGGSLLLAGLVSGESRRVLFLDDVLVRSAEGVERRLHAPVPREEVFIFDAPWEGGESGYAAVMPAPEGYRLYYRGGGETTREQTCVAFSSDGIAWERPNLGMHAFEGSTANNIFRMPTERKSYAESHNFFAFQDTAPGVAPEERWKGVGLQYYHNEKGDPQRMLAAFVSPDGLSWTRTAPEPAITQGAGFDSQNVAFRDPATGRFVCYSRTGRDGFRFIQRCESDDFRTWTVPEPIRFPEPPRTHFYTNAISPVPTLRPDDTPPVYVGMPMRFVPERKEVLGRATDGTSDAVLITSTDGVNWDFVSHDAWLRPGPDPANWGNAHGNMTPSQGILQTGPAEWSVYWMENYGSAAPLLRRGTLRPEGFVSLHGGAAGGVAEVGPLDLSSGRVVLNASTSAAGSIRLEVRNAAGDAVAGFTMDDFAPLWGDAMAIDVAWTGGATLPANLHDATLRIELKDADVYSVRVVRE